MRRCAWWREGGGRHPLTVAVLAAALTVPAVLAAEETTVELALAPGPRFAEPRPLAGTLRLLPAGGRDQAVAPRELRFRGAGPVIADLPAGSLWRLVPAARGWWAAEEVLQVQAGGTAAVVPFFPAAPLRGRLRVPPDRELPEDMLVGFEPLPPLGQPAAPPTAAASSVRCPVEADGSFACEVPAGAVDLSFRCAGFASEHRWAVRVGPEAGFDAGELTLRPGASMTGFLNIDGASVPSSAVIVELRPVSGSNADFRTEARLQRFVEITRLSPRGFFQFDGLTAGLYDVLVRAPGFAAARVGPVRIHAGRETVLREALELHPPVTVEVRVEPALDPAGQPWQVRLRWKEAGAGGALSTTGGPTAGGLWRSEPLAPRGGTLEVVAADGSVWHHQEVLVAPGMAPLSVRLDGVRLAGELTLNAEPVAGVLTLSQHGRRRSRRLEVDEDGRFEGQLPGEGEWSVDLQLPGERASQRLEPVTVRRPPEGEAAWLEIEIPDTRVRGRVVNEAEEPVPGVRISAWNVDRKLGTSSTLSDGEGRFSFRGLPPAEYTVSALDGRFSGDSVRLRVEEGGEGPEVCIVLEGAVEIGGRVVSPDGPVAGAVVQLFAETEPQRRLGLHRKVTGPDGGFRVRLPRSAVALRLLVLPPGYAARILRLPFDPARPLEVAVSDFGGTLVVDLALRPGEIDPRLAATSILSLDGAPMWLGALEDWVRFHAGSAPEAGRWVLPMMEVGQYALCHSHGDRCAGGWLPPNGELELTLPASSEGVGLTGPGEAAGTR